MKHGHATRKGLSPTYKSWLSMMTRCYNPNAENYCRYGGAGVTVHQAWHQFESFLAGMGERAIGQSLDRYPNSAGNYEPGNCRWATPEQQGRNRRNTVRVEHKGEVKPLIEWAELLGKGYDTLYDRIFKKGWAVERAFEKVAKSTLVVAGVERTYKEWADITGLHTECIRGRVKMGWPPERCVTPKV